MKSRNAWLYGLGLSGVLAFGLAGCGGGDVPDPSADEAAATEEEGGESPVDPSLPGPAAEAAVEPGMTPAPVAASATPEASAPTAPQAETPKTEAASSTKSDTAEMLAMATSAPAAPAGASAPASAPAGGPGGAAPGPGAPGIPPGAPGGEGERDLSMNPGIPGDSTGAAPPMKGPGAGEMAGERGPGAEGGLLGGSSDVAGGDNGPAEPGDTTSPHGAVKAFLYALEHKDRDRLAEATALRANSDEGGKYRELFSRIIDSSISDSELDDLSTKLQGYKDTGNSNQIKSTGREGVTIRKTLKDGTILQRTVTVRREKKGWGVLDITSPLEFDRPQMSKFPNRRR